MYVPPRNDPEYSRMRLDRIMGRRRLSFNPYTVSDERLLELVSQTGWGNEWDITQMTIVTFTRLRPLNDYRKFDGIFMLVANAPEEVFIPKGALTRSITANDTIWPERSWTGKTPIRNDKDVERLPGKQYFVSRIIRGVNPFGNSKGAYKMHRLYGKTAWDAATIREAMIAAKIEMLERILQYPESPDFLSCSKGFFDYESRIRQAIDLIRHFPDTPIPTE